MTALAEYARVLKGRAKSHHQRAQLEGEAEGLQARTANLEMWCSRIEVGVARRRVLETHGFPVVEAGTVPVDRVEAYAVLLLKPAIPPQAQWNLVTTAVRAFAERLEVRVREAVTAAYAELIGGILSAQIEPYRGDPNSAADAARLIIQLRAVKAVDWTHMSAAELDQVLTAARALRSGLQRLQQDGASEGLRKFLAMANAPEGASLDALTSELRGELNDRNLLSRLRIVLR